MKRPERGVELSCKGLNAWSLSWESCTAMVRRHKAAGVPRPGVRGAA